MSLETTISLRNHMTPVLESINTSLNYTISALENVERASKGSFDTSTLKAARESISKSTMALNQMEQETENLKKTHEKYNHELKKSETTLWSMAKKLVATVGLGLGAKQFVGVSDELSNIKARLNSINDGQRSVIELENLIFQSAQRSRGEYMMTADIVSRLGMQARQAFNNNIETIGFAENLNKLFKISGTDPMGVESVMYNLTQAMASGILRGQDFNAVMSNTPQILEITAEYLGHTMGDVRKLAEEGKLTADVVKAALLNATDDINRRFETMPLTFNDVATQMKNNFLRQMEPALMRFNSFLNTEAFENFTNRSMVLMGGVASSLEFVVEMGIRGFNLLGHVVENYGGIILGLIGIVGLYNGAIAFSNFLEGLSITSKALAAGQTVALTTAQKLYALITGQATLAQLGFNTAILTSPIFWLPAAIMLVVGALFAVVKWINRTKNETHSAVGIMAGSFMWLGGLLYNGAVTVFNTIIGALWSVFVNPFIGGVEWALNAAMGGFNNFGDAVKNLIGNMASWFLNLFKTVAGISDTIFGTDWRAGIENIQNNLRNVGRNDNYITLSRKVPQLQTVSLKEMYDKGYQWGANKEAAVRNKFNEVFNPEIPGIDTDAMPLAFDDHSKDMMSKLGDGVGEIAENTKDITGNTKDIKDEISWDNNNLTGLRDLIQARTIKELSREVVLKIHNEFTGDINNDVDVDSIIDKVNEKMVRELEVAIAGGI